MSRYQILVRVLDGIRAEAAKTRFTSLYAVGSQPPDQVWQARARAYVHLYLKVMFGLTEFEEREQYVTDGPQDGGIDGYFIEKTSRKIILIQSKFKITEDNFENKPIELEDMQIRRVLGGEESDENGVKYNGKIAGLQRKVSEIPDLGRYSYCIVMIANMAGISDDHIRRLADGFPAEILDFRRAYTELLFPVISGTLFKATGLNIALDVSNKSSGAKIGYTVATGNYDCEITVVFVPTIEIGRVMSRYKNSLLQYNPRSYLEFEGETVNAAMRETLLSETSNEFALLNNGITIVCDEVGINEQSGRRQRAQLFLLNPQIINGGQTAFTLSRIYKSLSDETRDATFAGKEVLVKAIALSKRAEANDDGSERVALIERISTATNNQTVVTLADKTSSDPLHTHIQAALFNRYGLIYERKRGEFGGGIRDGYISAADIVGRTLFARLYLAANGRMAVALRRKILREPLKSAFQTDPLKLDRFMIALAAYEFFSGGRHVLTTKRFTDTLPKVYAAVLAAQRLEETDPMRSGISASLIVERDWPEFLTFASKMQAPYIRTTISSFGKVSTELRDKRGVFGAVFQRHADEFFGIARHPPVGP